MDATTARQKRKFQNLTQGNGFICAMAVLVAALLVLAPKTVYDYRNSPVTDALADATAEAYFAERSGPLCTFKGVWHDWERDETITLGCLEMKGIIREGSYSSAMGPRATSNFSMSGTYDIDGDSCIHVVRKDGEGKTSNSHTDLGRKQGISHGDDLHR